MGIVLDTANLISRVVRRNVIGGVTGSDLLNNVPAANAPIARRINNLGAITTEGSGNLIQNIFNAGGKFVGWIGGLFKGLTISITTVFGWCVSTVEQLKAFDWNSTDKEIGEMIKANNLQLASLWGGLVGKGIGWLAGIAVGYGVGLVVPVIGGALFARYLALEVAKEGWEETKFALLNVLQQTFALGAKSLALTFYASTRNWVKKLPKEVLDAIFGAAGGDYIKNTWGEENAPTLSFNNFVEEQLDKIENPYLKNFTEELLEESWESFIEAGYVIAIELDRAYSQHRLGQQLNENSARTVIVYPNGELEDEVLNLQGVPQQEAIVTTQVFLNQQRLLQNRSVGEIVADRYQDIVLGRPQLRRLTIEFSQRDQPPWRLPNGKHARRINYTIPDAKVGLSWDDIYAAAKKYQWGKYRATAMLNNRRQMAVYGASPTEAKDKLEQLLTLSTAEIITLNISEEVTKPQQTKKEPTLVYPKAAYLLNRKSSLDGLGYTDISGKTYDQEIIRIPLWQGFKPQGFETLP